MLNILDLLSLVVTSPLLLKRNRINVIYCNGTQAKVVGALMGLINWCPVIWHVRNIQQTKLLGSVINTLARLPVVRRIICVSGAAADQFPGRRSWSSYITGSTSGTTTPPRRRAGSVCLRASGWYGLVGAPEVVPRKGYELFIEAAASLGELFTA
jgi:hypothetical protein